MAGAITMRYSAQLVGIVFGVNIALVLWGCSDDEKVTEQRQYLQPPQRVVGLVDRDSSTFDLELVWQNITETLGDSVVVYLSVARR